MKLLKPFVWHEHKSSLSAKWLKAENKLSSTSLCASGNDEEFHFLKGIKIFLFSPFVFIVDNYDFWKTLTCRRTFQLAIARSSFKVGRFDSFRLIGFVRLIHMELGTSLNFKEWILGKGLVANGNFDVFRTCCAFCAIFCLQKTGFEENGDWKGKFTFTRL